MVRECITALYEEPEVSLKNGGVSMASSHHHTYLQVNFQEISKTNTKLPTLYVQHIVEGKWKQSR